MFTCFYALEGNLSAVEVCSQGTYTTVNFIFKTSVVLYSVTKRISEMHQLKRE